MKTPVLNRGVLVISIDLDHVEGRVAAAERREMCAGTRQLLHLLTTRGVAATWCATEPAKSPLASPMIEHNMSHELALRGEPTWAGAAAPRAWFTQNLIQRINDARESGLNITALSTQEALPDDRCDILLKLGIVAMREDQAGGERNSGTAPFGVRYGLWNIPVTCRLPARGGWLPGWDGAMAARVVRQAAERRSLVHLAIDGASVLGPRTAGWRSMERMAALAAQLQAAGMLQVMTLSSAATHLMPARAVPAARSILRVA